MLEASRNIKHLEKLLNIKLYLVGGAVHDMMLGLVVKDWDFASPALPDEIEFKVREAGFKPYLIGKKYGTVGFKYHMVEAEKPVLVEITTFRGDVYSPGDRKPEVHFSEKIEEDLGRRDFTINSMAIDSKGDLIDPFGGLKDLENKLVRAVGNSTVKVKEDPLRILRGVRLAAQLDFEIESKTNLKMQEHRFLLFQISKERWVSELDRILSLENPIYGLQLLMNLRFLEVMIPELMMQKAIDHGSSDHCIDLWSQTCSMVKEVPAHQLELRWGTLLQNIGRSMIQDRQSIENDQNNQIDEFNLISIEIAKKICWYLKFSNQRTQYIVAVIQNHLQFEFELK